MLSWKQRGAIYRGIPSTLGGDTLPKWLSNNSSGEAAWLQKAQLFENGMESWINVSYLTEGINVIWNGGIIQHWWNNNNKEYDVLNGEINKATISVIINSVDKEKMYRYASEMDNYMRQYRLNLSKTQDEVWLNRIISNQFLNEYYEESLDSDIHRAMIDFEVFYIVQWKEVGPVIRRFRYNFDIGMNRPGILTGNAYCMLDVGAELRLI